MSPEKAVTGKPRGRTWTELARLFSTATAITLLSAGAWAQSSNTPEPVGPAQLEAEPELELPLDTSAPAKTAPPAKPTEPELEAPPEASPNASNEPKLDAEKEPAIVPEAKPPASADKDTGDVTDENIEDILDHPTRSVEDYEKVRAEVLHKRTLPDYSISLIIAPRVFSSADLRQPAHTGFDQTNPTLFGGALSYDRSLMKYHGVLSAGLDGGFYGSALSNPYGGLLPGFLSLYPHATYEANFFHKQLIVPIVRLGPEFIRVHYTFENQSITAIKILPRIDLGAMLYLNVLEPTSASDMESNWGIKRTYVGAFFTIAQDSSQQTLNLTDHSFRIVLRFEE